MITCDFLNSVARIMINVCIRMLWIYVGPLLLKQRFISNYWGTFTFYVICHQTKYIRCILSFFSSLIVARLSLCGVTKPVSVHSSRRRRWVVLVVYLFGQVSRYHSRQTTCSSRLYATNCECLNLKNVNILVFCFIYNYYTKNHS